LDARCGAAWKDRHHVGNDECGGSENNEGEQRDGGSRHDAQLVGEQDPDPPPDNNAEGTPIRAATDAIVVA
jgi:hypothetical protein